MIVLLALAFSAALLSVVGERIGLSGPLIAGIDGALVVMTLLAAAASGATMRTALFFGLRGGMGLLATAFGMVALANIAVPPSHDAFAPIAALIAATLPAACLASPLLARSGAATPGEFLGRRFTSRWPALLALPLTLALLGVIALAAADAAISRLGAIGPLSPAALRALVIILAAAPVLAGGRAGAGSALAALASIVLAGALLPILFHLIRAGLPSEIIDPIDHASGLLHDWLRPASGLALERAEPRWPEAGRLADTAGPMLGLGLVFLFVLGLRRSDRAVAAGALGAAFAAVLALAAAATLIAVPLSLEQALIGTRVDQVPARFLDPVLGDALTICGRPAGPDLPGACTAPLSFRAPPPHVIAASDIAIGPALLDIHAAEAIGLPAIGALLHRLGPGLLALAALTLAGFAVAATLAHDGYHRLLMPKATASARLALTRLLTVLAIAIAVDIAPLLHSVAADLAIADLLNGGLSLGAATLLPLLLVALLPRAGSATALLTLAGGIAVYAIFVAQPETMARAGLYGLVGALVMACAGLASCPPSAAERGFIGAVLGCGAPRLDGAT